MKTRIRQMRGLLGYTQEYTATKTGINPVSLSRMENEEQDPSLQQIINLASLFGCSVDFLVFRSDIKNPTSTQQSKEITITPETVIPELRKWNLNQLAKMSGAMELEVSNRVYAKNEEESRKIESQNGGLFGSINTGRTAKKQTEGKLYKR